MDTADNRTWERLYCVRQLDNLHACHMKARTSQHQAVCQYLTATSAPQGSLDRTTRICHLHDGALQMEGADLVTVDGTQQGVEDDGDARHEDA